MKQFFAGFAIATIGLSGISSIIDVGLSLIKSQLHTMNNNLERVEVK